VTGGVLALVDAPAQVVFGGAMRGLTIGVMAVAVILIYRSSKVINFALGELGALGAALFVRFTVNWRWNHYAALVVVVAAGAVMGALMELAVVRRLFRAPRVILLVATIGAAQLLLFLQFVLPNVERYGAYPRAWTDSWTVGGVIVRSEHVLVLAILPALVAALGWFLNRTKHGIAVRAASENSDAARLAGISTKRLSTIVWSMAGAFAVVATILSAPIAGATTASAGALGPDMLLRTFAAALVAGMVSFPVAVVAGIGIGIFEAVLFYNHTGDAGLINAALLGIVLVAVLVLSLGRRGLAEREAFSFSPRVRPVPAALARSWLVRNHVRIGVALAVAAAVALPLLVDSPSRQFLYSRVLLFALVALSLTVLTGWAGQLSLGQFALVGVGAMTTYALVGNRLVFPLAVAGGALAAALAAVVVGTPALRMRGLYLAVTTLALAVAAPWLLSRSLFVGDQRTLLLRRPEVGGISLASQRAYYWVCLGALVVGVVLVARIRRSGLGRSLLAVRDNEQSASALGLSPARVKLVAFGVSGLLAGLAGGLLAGLLVQFEPDRFTASQSLTVVAIAVVGGLASIGGSVLGALVIVGLPAFFPDTPQVALLTSGAGMLLLLMYFPAGLVQVLYNLRDAVLGVLARRLSPAEPAAPRAQPPTVALGLRSRPPVPGDVTDALVVDGLSVRYGPRLVLHDVSISVPRGAVVGLIGANGAGKSTLMQAVGGYVPSRGRVHLLGQDVTGLPAHRRARAGMGRTFQGAELFGDLTVRDTIAVALERRAPAGLVTVGLGLPRARRVERAKRAHAEEICDFLGLGAYADRFVSELSTGTRRIVELACLLAVDAKVLCLDEPTAGVAQRESEAFGPLLLRLREELDASMLLIEHDMPLVMAVSDRITCLEAGRVIAEGSPTEVRDDPLVIASYLGTDEQAIARSGTVPADAAEVREVPS
jgi:ABC-type branched-subunit amino acid transport system ATPase component/ABC-type branched-subunit amino acid transport system permease subunit